MPHDEDIDVARERHRVLSGNVHNDMLTIENLRKVRVRKAMFAHHREPHVVFDIASFVSHTVCDVLNTDMLLGHTEVVILWSMPYMYVFVFQASINK